MKTEFDLIVVGGGGSGLAAAVSAAEHGLDVLVLEKCDELGGTTGIAVGSFTANQTTLQRKAGVADGLQDHIIDAGKFATHDIEACNNVELREYFLSHAAETLDWLTGMGLHFHGPSPEPPNRVPRMHNVVPGAKAYVAVLHSRLLKLGGTIHVHAPVTKLLRDPEGKVSGVVAEVFETPVSFQAKHGVVLAAGDYANSPEIIAKYKGDRFAAIEGINPHAHGDGHRLAEEAGARLVNMEITYGPELRFVPPPTRTFQQLLPAEGPVARLMGWLLPCIPRFVMNRLIRRLLVTWQHPENSLFEHGAILVNRKGERFCDESRWPDREIAVANQPEKECFILLDEALIERYSRWPHFISTAPKIAYAYVSDYLRLRPDIASKADDLDSFAASRNLPVQNLRNSASAAGMSGKQWVLLGPARAWFTTTEGGASINHKFEVLDDQGQTIPSLYAVGQNGLGGQILWGHGLHIGWAMTSGRLAGRQIAQESHATDSSDSQ